MAKTSHTLDTLPPLTDADRAALRELTERPETGIDLTDPDAPQLTGEQYAAALKFRGPLYRPVKEQVTTKLDKDVVQWLKAAGPGYQTRMNAILRREMLRALVKGKAA